MAQERRIPAGGGLRRFWAIAAEPTLCLAFHPRTPTPLPQAINSLITFAGSTPVNF